VRRLPDRSAPAARGSPKGDNENSQYDGASDGGPELRARPSPHAMPRSRAALDARSGGRLNRLASFLLSCELDRRDVRRLRRRLGDGVPQATVTAPKFELFRALSGRRSLDQIQAFSWDGDAKPYLTAFSPFEPPVEAIIE
jgi:hypothetical protein